MDSRWHVIPVENLLTGLFYDVLADTLLPVQGETCAFMKPWDARGWSKISLINLDGKVQSTLISIFERKRHISMVCSEVTAHRKQIERL